MNRLFVAKKPIFISSNSFAGYLKRKYRFDKIGFSGTLDPFATGSLIMAAGQYTKLFSYLNKTPKVYRATLWLGAQSPSLDLESARFVQNIDALDPNKIVETLSSLEGDIRYAPPVYSAKKISGKKAYDLARAGKKVRMKEINSHIYSMKLLMYNHPFVHFEAKVSEGTYIRSLGEIIANRLGVPATLSSLERIAEGDFFYDNEKSLDPLEYITIPRNSYKKGYSHLEKGEKLHADIFEKKEDGIYLVEGAELFSIVEISNGSVNYKINRIKKIEKE